MFLVLERGCSCAAVVLRHLSPRRERCWFSIRQKASLLSLRSFNQSVSSGTCPPTLVVPIVSVPPVNMPSRPSPLLPLFLSRSTHTFFDTSITPWLFPGVVPRPLPKQTGHTRVDYFHFIDMTAAASVVSSTPSIRLPLLRSPISVVRVIDLSVTRVV